MKILIIGEWYSSNLGDGIICENVEKIVREIYKEKNVTIDRADISLRDGFIKNSEHIVNGRIRKVNYIRNILYKSEYLTYKLQDIKNKRKEKIKKICNHSYDLAIFAGGHMIMPYFSFQIYYFVKYLVNSGTKVIFNACGVGEIKSRILLNKVRQALMNKNIVYISSRDNVEKLKKEYLIGDKKLLVKKTYDPAIFTNETYGVKKDISSEVIGLGIMNLLDEKKEDVIKFWKSIIDNIEKQGKRWQIFCNGSQEDYELACECLRNVKTNNSGMINIAPKPNRPIDLVKLISKYKSIISFRLHSHIIAYSLDIPTIAIVWNEKVKFFFKDLNLEDRCFEIKDKPEDIVKKLLEVESSKYDKSIKDKQRGIIRNNLMIF